MRLDQILTRIGAAIVKTDNNPQKVVLFIRSGRSQRQLAQWRTMVEEYLGAHASLTTPKWGLDISRSYYITEAKAVKYLWRIILTGDVRNGAEAFSRAVIRSITVGGGEVTSMPLIGNTPYVFDPAKGKMKGGHDGKTAAQARSAGMSGGSIQ